MERVDSDAEGKAGDTELESSAETPASSSESEIETKPGPQVDAVAQSTEPPLDLEAYESVVKGITDGTINNTPSLNEALPGSSSLSDESCDFILSTKPSAKDLSVFYNTVAPLEEQKRMIILESRESAEAELPKDKSDELAEINKKIAAERDRINKLIAEHNAALADDKPKKIDKKPEAAEEKKEEKSLLEKAVERRDAHLEVLRSGIKSPFAFAMYLMFAFLAEALTGFANFKKASNLSSEAKTELDLAGKANKNAISLDKKAKMLEDKAASLKEDKNPLYKNVEEKAKSLRAQANEKRSEASTREKNASELKGKAGELRASGASHLINALDLVTVGIAGDIYNYLAGKKKDNPSTAAQIRKAAKAPPSVDVVKKSGPSVDIVKQSGPSVDIVKKPEGPAVQIVSARRQKRAVISAGKRLLAVTEDGRGRPQSHSADEARVLALQTATETGSPLQHPDLITSSRPHARAALAAASMRPNLKDELLQVTQEIQHRTGAQIRSDSLGLGGSTATTIVRDSVKAVKASGEPQVDRTVSRQRSRSR